jgi:hypothetical protein
MELGPDLIVLLLRSREMDPADLDGLLQAPGQAAERAPCVSPPPEAAGMLLTVVVEPSRPPPPPTILEKFRAADADPLQLHYGAFLPPFDRVYPGHKATRLGEILNLSKAERPLLLVGVMRDNAPQLVVLWGPSQHLDPPYDRTPAHGSYVMFCRDVVQGNLPASTDIDCDWLVTESLELLSEAAFSINLLAGPLGASVVAEEEDGLKEDLYVARAAVLPGCLVPDLLRLSRDPVAAWRLLRAWAAELGLLESCSALWRLLRALSSAIHRKDTCVTLGLVNGNAHFVSSCRSTLKAVLPALAVSTPSLLGLWRLPPTMLSAPLLSLRPSKRPLAPRHRKWSALKTSGPTPTDVFSY